MSGQPADFHLKLMFDPAFLSPCSIEIGATEGSEAIAVTLDVPRAVPGPKGEARLGGEIAAVFRSKIANGFTTSCRRAA